MVNGNYIIKCILCNDCKRNGCRKQIAVYQDCKLTAHQLCKILCNGQSKTASLCRAGFLSPHKTLRQVLPRRSLFRQRIFRNIFDTENRIVLLYFQIYINPGIFECIFAALVYRFSIAR